MRAQPWIGWQNCSPYTANHGVYSDLVVTQSWGTILITIIHFREHFVIKLKTIVRLDSHKFLTNYCKMYT